MASRLGFGRRKRKAPPLDEFGGTADGGLAIIDEDGHLVHMTQPRVAGALRYFLARVQLHDAQGMPERLALTSALVGEGVTYVTRSLAAAVAYDTGASVVIVDLTFRRPGAAEGKSGRRKPAAAERAPGRRRESRRAGARSASCRRRSPATARSSASCRTWRRGCRSCSTSRT